MLRTDGAVVVHSVRSPDPGGPQQVGDQVDRAGGEHGAVRALRARAAAASAARGSRSAADAREAELARQRLQASRAAARAGWRWWCTRCARACGMSALQHRRGVLVVEDRDDGHELAAVQPSRAATRPAPPSPPGCARRRAPSPDRSSDAPRSARAPASRPPPRAPPSSSSVAEAAPRAAARASAKLRRWNAPRAAGTTPGLAGAATTARRARRLARQRRARRDAGPAPITSVEPGRTTASFSRGDVARSSGPASACAPGPTFVSTCTSDGITFVAS